MQTNRRKAFLKIREILQKHDPLDHLVRFGGDRFDKDLYGYESTTILEKAGLKPEPGAVEEILRILARTQKCGEDDNKIQLAAAEIHAFLFWQ